MTHHLSTRTILTPMLIWGEVDQFQIQIQERRPMSEGTNKAKLKDTLRTLNEQWASLHSQWKDSASESLDREAIQPANDAVRLAILAVEQLSEAISKAKRDCDAG